MKLYTVYSDSHAGLLRDHLQPSCGWADEVLAVHAAQDCPSGVYQSDAWDAAVRRKCQVILDAIDAGEYFAFADPDVTFFQDPTPWFKAAIAGVDIALQRDDQRGTACTGSFVCRPTPAARACGKRQPTR